MVETSVGGGDAPVSASNKTNKRPRQSRDRGWIAPKFTPRSSVRRTSSARSLTFIKKSDIGQVRAPWVPAPAKSTSSIIGGEALFSGLGSSNHPGRTFVDMADSPSSSSPRNQSPSPMASASAKAKARPSSSHNIFANATSSQNQLKNDHGVRRPTPKTACLQEKREEVIKLWQHNLVNDDPTLVTKIENVNRLALEAAEEVEFLRRTIQALQKKTDGLSDEDCTHLNELRVKVLSKVKEFEEADKALQGTIIRNASAKISVVNAGSQPSQNDIGPVALSETVPTELKLPEGQLLSSHSIQDLVFLKEKPDNFSNDYKSDHEEEVLLSTIQAPFLSDKSTVASTVPSAESLSRLRLLHPENLTFPPIQEGIRLTRSQSYTVGINATQHHQPRKIRFAEETTPQPSQSEGESLPENVTSANELYREKISHLQRKLMNTEEEVEELKSDMERIESDANFRVMMLKNSVQDQFESFKVIPDYIQMVDVKLTESIHHKMQLQHDLNEKDTLLQEEKELNRSLRKEADELREKLRVAENVKELQVFKSAELEKSNNQLKKEVGEAAKLTTDLANQVHILRDREASYATPRSPRVSSMENQRLKLKCSELKEELAQAKRIIQTLKKSKAKLTCDSNQRIEELLQTLQTAQHHKRILGDQIRLLKKSYNELFPCDCKSHAYVTHKCKDPPKFNKPKRKPEPVKEPLVESTDAWRTGEGILLDNILDLPLDYLSSKTNENPG